MSGPEESSAAARRSGARGDTAAAASSSTDFEHERDPRCSYFEELSRRCGSVEDPNAEAGRRMECKMLRKLLRRCPGQPVEEVERVEETTSHEGSNGIVDFGFSSSSSSRQIPGNLGDLMEDFYRGMHPGGGMHSDADRGGMHPGSDGVVDPFDLMQRGIDEIFHELGRATGELFRPAFGGGSSNDGGDDDGAGASRCWPGARQDVPPHYRHRYHSEQTQDKYQDHANRRRWEAYKSEDV
ncbi:Hypothetical Protein FCC1311_106962 [Hondaea fermentalgiana]|uniref:Uncharacterized protein n=1 Tax=Hondaea fermentalgiana TaxID=2315210 RepID=A0A2R5GUD4_9STRA|nr:Hypothetical Protein FCC1311_106962 [Hondaea fermentalgiana]|eukprot:GBG34472.1 Hypothetical Protein FCC1311_106962 [Hondaea fermentalgiana]